MEKVRLMFANWKTAIPGVLILLCGGSSYMDLIPAAWQMSANGFCMLMTGLGLIAAKDADKSNSPKAVATPTTVL